jgi:hypothetical protein
MAQVVGHPNLEELQAGHRPSRDATKARHYQVIRRGPGCCALDPGLFAAAFAD